MLRRSAPALLCLAVLLVAARLSAASSNFKVVEEATRFSLRGERAEVSLAFENPAGRDFAARARAELLDPRGDVRAHAERDVSVRGGRGALELALPFRLAALKEDERRELPWFRLRYRVAPAPGAGAPAAEGLVSLSEITPDLFELHVARPSYVYEGMRYRASRFGVAAADWPIAEGTRLGTYTAHVETEGGDFEEGAGRVSFNVSRYELPTFAVGELPGEGRDGAAAPGAAETPRLREYFPETLVWQSLVETDAAGRATVRFKLADTITTWRLAVVGSTADGELGLAERARGPLPTHDAAHGLRRARPRRPLRGRRRESRRQGVSRRQAGRGVVRPQARARTARAARGEL